MTKEERDNVLNYLSGLTAWAEVGIQSIQKGQTVPDLNFLDNKIRTALSQDPQELVDALEWYSNIDNLPPGHEHILKEKADEALKKWKERE